MRDQDRAEPPEQVSEVEDFTDPFDGRDGDEALTRAAMRLSAESLWRVWDNEDDGEYDAP